MRDAGGHPVDNTREPEVLYPLQGSNIGHVYVDDAWLWFVHGDYAFQAPKAGGGTPVRLGDVRGGASTRFFADSDAIYWLNDDRIERVPKAGGTAEEWLLGSSFAYGGWVIVDSYVYLLDGAAKAIWRVPVGGGKAEMFVGGLNTEGDKGGGVYLTLQDRTLYASYLSDIWSIALDSSAVMKISPPNVSMVSEIVTLGDAHYFIDGRHDTGGTLFRFRDGAVPESIQNEPASLNVSFILPDATRNKLYWIASTIGPLIEFDIALNKMTTLTSKQTSNGLPASDDTYVYWARNSLDIPPGIMRLKKR